MKKSIFVTLILSTILSAVTLGFATIQAMKCPLDGEGAGFTGNRKADKDQPTDRSKDLCEYSHQHPVKDANGARTETHTFWRNCGD